MASLAVERLREQRFQRMQEEHERSGREFNTRQEEMRREHASCSRVQDALQDPM